MCGVPLNDDVCFLTAKELETALLYSDFESSRLLPILGSKSASLIPDVFCNTRRLVTTDHIRV